MTARLGQYKPRDVERALLRAGFHFTHQQGSHRYYALDGRTTAVAFHPGDVPRYTLHAILKQEGLTEKEFAALLRGKKAA